MKCHICNAIPNEDGEVSVESIHTIEELDELREKMGGVIKIGKFKDGWIIENTKEK